MVDISDAILPLATALERARVPYAFGGAIAHGYHAQPRATTDVDLNIFVRETESAPVLAALAELGVSVEMERDSARIHRDGQIRLRWGQIMVDLFFANFAFLEACRERVWHVPFEDRRIPILSAEDLVICKVAFNRDKDWLDLRETVEIQGERLDLGHIRHWLAAILGRDDPRTLRFEALVVGER